MTGITTIAIGSAVISLMSLAISAATMYFSWLRQGQLRMTQPAWHFLVSTAQPLPEWAQHLYACPMLFSSWSMGDEHQPALQQLVDDFHDPDRPRHHALHDAHALRLCMLYAMKHGWKPEDEQ